MTEIPLLAISANYELRCHVARYEGTVKRNRFVGRIVSFVVSTLPLLTQSVT